MIFISFSLFNRRNHRFCPLRYIKLLDQGLVFKETELRAGYLFIYFKTNLNVMSIFSSFFSFKVTDNLSSLLHNISNSTTYLGSNLTQSAQYLTGNITSSISNCGFLAQVGLASLGLAQCICSTIDGFTTISPVAKPLYFTSAIASGLGSVSSLGCCVASVTCPSIVPIFIGTGMACRIGAQHATKVALLTNPCPCLSEII